MTAPGGISVPPQQPPVTAPGGISVPHSEADESLDLTPAAPGPLHRAMTFRAPFHAASLLGFLAARAVEGVEEAGGVTYRRSLRLPHGPAVIAVDLVARAPSWRLEAGDPRDGAAAEAACRALLDLGADPAAIDAVLGEDPLLRASVAAAPGRRVPGCVDAAEIAIRAVLGQQVSVAAARTHAARLAQRWGEELPEPRGGVTRVFPSPASLAELDPDRLGMPRARGRALVELAAALADGLDPRDREALLAQRGVGPWTAGYVAMRCGEGDVLLETDLGVRRGLARLGFEGDVAARGGRWRPWRSYAMQHIWAAA